jgi:hypothetical protein
MSWLRLSSRVIHKAAGNLDGFELLSQLLDKPALLGNLPIGE